MNQIMEGGQGGARQVTQTQWRLLQAAYIIGGFGLAAPAYPLLEADQDLWAIIYGAFAIVALTLLRHRVLARVERPQEPAGNR